jgi:hypothetical protein
MASSSAPWIWSSFAGFLAADPQVVRNLDGRLEVIVIYIDRSMYHRVQLTPGSTGWTPWSKVGTGVFLGAVPGGALLKPKSPIKPRVNVG